MRLYNSCYRSVNWDERILLIIPTICQSKISSHIYSLTEQYSPAWSAYNAQYVWVCGCAQNDAWQ